MAFVPGDDASALGSLKRDNSEVSDTNVDLITVLILNQHPTTV